MLKLIAENSAELLDFIDGLDTPLSVPQKRHVLQIADALITAEGRKDWSNLYFEHWGANVTFPNMIEERQSVQCAVMHSISL